MLDIAVRHALRFARGRWLRLMPLALLACRPSGHRVQLVELQVADIDRAVGFYHAVFGWDASRPSPSYALLDAKPVAIGLISQAGAAPGGPTIVIAARDLEPILRRVVQNGGALREPIAPSWRGRQFRCADPDGNELVVWSARSGDGEAP